MQREDADKTERFQVLPLDLKVGQKLVLCVSAEDGDNINGPHHSRGEEYAFQIVSDEDLLALLYVKEVNLRERFERIIAERARPDPDRLADPSVAMKDSV